MPIQLGFFDSAGHPRLRIRVRGTNPNQFTDEEALLDTGFTGFLMLPIAKALPLGLVLVSTGNYTIANGSSITSFVAKGTVTVGAPLASSTKSLRVYLSELGAMLHVNNVPDEHVTRRLHGDFKGEALGYE